MSKRIHGEERANAWRSQGGALHGPAAPPPADTAPLLRSQIVKKIQPHQNGARRLSERFADRLVCVRYRTDPDSGRRFTTVDTPAAACAPRHPRPACGHHPATPSCPPAFMPND